MKYFQLIFVTSLSLVCSSATGFPASYNENLEGWPDCDPSLVTWHPHPYACTRFELAWRILEKLIDMRRNFQSQICALLSRKSNRAALLAGLTLQQIHGAMPAPSIGKMRYKLLLSICWWPTQPSFPSGRNRLLEIFCLLRRQRDRKRMRTRFVVWCCLQLVHLCRRSHLWFRNSE